MFVEFLRFLGSVVVQWNSDAEDALSWARIELFLGLPAKERMWSCFLRDTIPSFNVPLAAVPLNLPVSDPAAVHPPVVNPVVQGPVIPDPAGPVLVPFAAAATSTTNIARRTRRNAGVTMERIRATRAAARTPTSAQASLIIPDDPPTPSKAPASKSNKSIMPESSTTISDVGDSKKLKRKRSGLEFVLPDLKPSSSALDDGAELLKLFGKESSHRMPEASSRMLANSLVADTRDVRFML
jgi:hypothetical protein